MNGSSLWRKLARRSAILAVGLSALVLLTGCPWDEDDFIPKLWEIEWFDNVNPGDDGSVVIEIDLEDLNTITSYMTTVDTYTVTINVSGSSITITITDSASPFTFNASGTITSSTTANGTYTGTSSSGSSFSGTWTVMRAN